MKQKQNSPVIIFLTIGTLIIASIFLASDIRSGGTSKTTTGYFKYTVQREDTCSSIANAYGVSIASIVLRNGLTPDCGGLYIGQKLNIAYPITTPVGSIIQTTEIRIDCETEKYYTVKDGDTLAALASRFHTSEKNIMDFNGLSNKMIVPGTQLVIPLCYLPPAP